MNNIKNYTKYAESVFKEKGIELSYKKGQQFIRYEDEAQGIYYLDKGLAFSCSPKKSGLNQIIGVFEPGCIFGKVGSVMHQRHTHMFIEALTDCLVYRLDCDSFVTTLKSDSHFFESYMGQVSFNNVYLLNHAIILGEKDLYKRVITGFLLLIDYHGDIHNDTCVLRISLTQEQLASIFCLSREYLNKILKRLRNSGLMSIDRNGFIKFTKVSKLRLIEDN